MTVTLKKEELAAWDSFANAVMSALVTARPISSHDASEVAAGFADEMIKRRRERIAQPEPMPSLNLS